MPQDGGTHRVPLLEMSPLQCITAALLGMRGICLLNASIIRKNGFDRIRTAPVLLPFFHLQKKHTYILGQRLKQPKPN